MFKLIAETDIVPKSLFITDVKIDTELSATDIEGVGCVFRGEHKRHQVALKLLDKGHKNVSVLLPSLSILIRFFKGTFSQDFCLEVLAWRSLSHHSVLPLLGIFIDNMQPFFVLPCIKGTLTLWRRTHTPLVSEIHRLVRFRRFLEHLKLNR